MPRCGECWRVFDSAHQKRNLAEYEGFLEVEESTIAELCMLAGELIVEVEKLRSPAHSRSTFWRAPCSNEAA